MDFKTAVLENGLRLLHIRTKSPVTHLGLFINAGTRDEEPSENGLAHFIEHTIFKGTSRRKSYHVLTRLENVGGDLNAFTTKEETCIYATVLGQHCERAMDLMADIVLHATFPEKEIRKEKDVIIDEINSYKDTPSEEIYDVFEEKLFCGHPLGMNILGTKEHLEKFSRGNIVRFIEAHYIAGNMVLCTVGASEPDRVFRMATKYFQAAPDGSKTVNRSPFSQYVPFHEKKDKDTFQAHCIIGNLAYNRHDERRFAMHLLNNVLGGPAMNSRLSLAIRERHGYAYNVESVYLPYTDSGVFSIYLGTDNNNVSKVLKVVDRELGIFRKSWMGTLQFSQAKKQLIGQIAIANESNLGKMMSNGKTFLHDNRVDSFSEVQHKIEGITREQVMEVANEVFDRERMSSLIYK